MSDLTEEEIDYILAYTGLDAVIDGPLKATPVIHFYKHNNVIEFVTILSKELNTI